MSLTVLSLATSSDVAVSVDTVVCVGSVAPVALVVFVVSVASVHPANRIKQQIATAQITVARKEYATPLLSILVLSCPQHLPHLHQREPEQVLSAPLGSIKTLFFIEADAAGPDGIAMSALHEPGISGIEQFLFQVFISPLPAFA